MQDSDVASAQSKGNKLTCLQEIEIWVAALARYDNNEFDDALAEFDKISDTSKILFNMGVIHATLGEHEKAVCGATFGLSIIIAQNISNFYCLI